MFNGDFIKGISIILINKTKDGTDPFGHPIYKDTEETVENVLVGEPTTEDIQNDLTRYGKIVKYTLAIPKGDTHIWEDTEVILPSPFEGKYKTIGFPTAGIEKNIPLKWNKKVHLERIKG